MIKARKSIARTVRFVILKLKLSIWGRTEAGTWANRGYSSPAPRKVKLNVLARYSRVGDTWIETGTLTGETTAYLAKRSDQVFSIEPSPHFADRARKRFINSTNVTILEGWD